MSVRPDQYRKNIRLKDFDYSSAGYSFMTIVRFMRNNYFGNIIDGEIDLKPLGMIVDNIWHEIPIHFPYIEVDSHIVMPNHFHGIIIINNLVGAPHAEPLPIKIQPLGVIIGSFKSAVTKQIHALGLIDQEEIWQRNYYEHIIRDEIIKRYLNTLKTILKTGYSMRKISNLIDSNEIFLFNEAKHNHSESCTRC